MASKEKNKDYKKKGVSKGTHARSGAASSGKAKKNERTGGLLGMTPGTGAEKKYNDTSLASGSILNLAGPAVPLLINGVAQGTDANQRVGRKINWDSILIRLRLTVGATPTSDSYRIMLVVDKQANAAAATAANMLESTVFTTANNMANRARFVTLWDKKGVVTTGGDNSVVIEELYLRKKFQTIYSGTGATIGDITSGALYLLVFGSLAVTATQLVATGYIRLRYLDD